MPALNPAVMVPSVLSGARPRLRRRLPQPVASGFRSQSGAEVERPLIEKVSPGDKRHRRGDAHRPNASRKGSQTGQNLA